MENLPVLSPSVRLQPSEATPCLKASEYPDTLLITAWGIQVESWESRFLGLSSERARVPWEICLKDWEAIKFSDEETWTWLLLRIIFEVIYFTWFIGRVLAVRGT